MSTISNVIKFYRDCYAFDYRSFNVRNFFAREAQYPYVIDRLNILNKAGESVLVEARWGKKVLKELAINGKEKSLYAGALFLFGKQKMLGREIRVAPPLFLYEAFLIDTYGNYRLSLDMENPIVNPYFVEMVNSLSSDIELSYEEFSAGFPSGNLGVAEILQIETWLEKQIPFLDISSLQNWYVDYKQIENARFAYKENRASDRNRLVAGVSVALLKKQEGSRGVINELNELSNRKISQNTLNHIFEASNLSIDDLKLDGGKVPLALSQRQLDVFSCVSKEKVSMVIGPPGTGKSYTIAALATALVSNGNSVLIASKNSQAGKVIADKIENDVGLKGILIKAARKSYKHHLVNKLDSILSGMHWKNNPNKNVIDATKTGIEHTQRVINSLTAEIEKREKEELRWAEFFATNRNGFFDKFRQRWIEYQHLNAAKIWKIKTEIDSLRRKNNRNTRSYIRKKLEWNLFQSIDRHRKELVLFKESLQSKNNDGIEKLGRKGFQNVLKSIPAWVIKTGDAHHILPLEPEIFDVLIIDEASQCDVASCLPLIYRAKRIVIIGDPKQLRHISFLSFERQELLNKQYLIEGYQYRDYSILDLITDKLPQQKQVTFLNEHFRSLPDIIAFSNEKFYGGNLYLMTSNPNSNILKNIYINQVDGKRNSKGENNKEVAAIMTKIASIIKAELGIEKQVKSTIGIISPFRAQVGLLKSSIRQKFTLEQIRAHEILIGTPFNFQGEERDVILLSFVLDQKTHNSSFTYLNRPDVFNVAITRARSLQIVYISVAQDQISKENLLSEYLSHIESSRAPKSKANQELEHDSFSKEIEQTLVNWGLNRILFNHAISGVIVDLVVVHNQKTYCIDLIGYPGEFQPMLQAYQIDMLDRMGHPIFLLPYSEWHLNRDVTIESLHAFIFTQKNKNLD